VSPVGRLAPSPTGLLHLGHARTFLLAWWSIRSRAGTLLLRMEDLDGPRVNSALLEAAVRDLEWLGLDWDGAVLRQSESLPRLNAAIARLLEQGLAYPCVCTRGDLRTAATAPQQGDAEIRYPGTCRGRFSSLSEAERASGREAGIRLKVREGPVTFVDGVHGPCAFDVATEVGDFLVARRDKAPAYQLATAVDDAAQGVTEVLRGDDLLPSAARQMLVQEALGLAQPRYLHVPLVLDAHGRRLAKRADDLSLRELRERGLDPRAIVAWAARSAGLDVPERVSAAEALHVFDIGRLPREPLRLPASTFA
jgi:glutamyl-tRNA synthetase